MSGWTSPVTTVAPIGVAVVTADALAHLVADSSDTSRVAIQVADAVDMVEGYCSTRLLTQTVTLQRADLAPVMPLPIGPVQTVALTYLDANGASQTLPTGLYALVGACTLEPRIERLKGQQWPALLAHPTAVTLAAVVGYGNDASKVPGKVRRAILLLVGDFYANREDTVAERGVVPATLPNGVTQLLANERLF